jgi:hypothetical protein
MFYQKRLNNFKRNITPSHLDTLQVSPIYLKAPMLFFCLVLKRWDEKKNRDVPGYLIDM